VWKIPFGGICKHMHQITGLREVSHLASQIPHPKKQAVYGKNQGRKPF